MSQYGPILLICHGFPPVRGIGGRRWAKFAKELARRGYTVHVIRSAGSKGRMDSLWSEDTRHEGIVHHPLPHAYPAVMTKRPLFDSTFGAVVAHIESHFGALQP